MSKKPSKHGPNKAKSIIAQPLFRSRQERAGKGKGSYRREAFQSNSWRLLNLWLPEGKRPSGMIRSAPDL
jgi:alternative ribosome-rescue factor